MATFKTISDGNIQQTRNVLNQLVDFVAEDVSGSATNLTRKKFQVFVTGASGPGVTSSLFQTVFDQNYALQTSNELFDMTIGIFDGSSVVTDSTTGNDFNSKRLFPSSSLMMREKISNYSQFAQILLGDSTAQFSAPFSEGSATDKINVALFMPFKRLFSRDGIKRETFAMRFFQSASQSENKGAHGGLSANLTFGSRSATDRHASGSVIYTDVGSAAQVETSPAGGAVGNIVNSANTSESVGLMFYDYGIAMFDLAKITSGSQIMSGAIGTAYTPKPTIANAGIGKEHKDPSDATKMVMSGKFIPDFVVSASIDNIIDHIAFTRFGSGSETFLTFQNNTFINSTLYFCRATADEFNFSTNPTYKDSDGKIVVIDSNQEGIQKSFAFVTTVGLYNANEDLLAVAKLSRPVMKNDEKDLTFRVRLDF